MGGVSTAPTKRTTEPDFDPWRCEPDLQPLRAAARSGDVATVHDALVRLGGDEQATVAHCLLAEIDELDGPWRAALAAQPADPVLGTLRAARLTVTAWRARGSGRASTVTREGWRMFSADLEAAERTLVEVCGRHPDHTPAWDARLTTARGLELGLAEARRRYARVEALDPHRTWAQRSLVQQLCPKWSGSWEDAFGFARERAAAAPDGHPSAALVAAVHVERWLEDKDGALTGDVLDEIEAAAARSVLHERSTPSTATSHAHSELAMLLSVGGRPAAAHAHFEALGDAPTDSGWCYTAGPGREYLRRRRTALKAGGAR
ncbi:hypothetical protein ATJ88_1973 [Isoptericola jiangsuensis]|uniref:DUF4034 domain-containing protein n=1 Tax=Isoptericola jiangsuensis TaxID=548579 RepID=A0A2A9EWN1_9MICO|nr:hypothetical protein [Isoptericola jiangsuensis]PFG43288.1 hypothetical protein ATJ88_1973 [Isoptericola jiangsuensis]